jgi:hypothetical protein
MEYLYIINIMENNSKKKNIKIIIERVNDKENNKENNIEIINNINITKKYIFYQNYNLNYIFNVLSLFLHENKIIIFTLIILFFIILKIYSYFY